MPAKEIESPLPRVPKGKPRGVFSKVGVWIAPNGTVDEVVVIDGTPEWRDEVTSTVKGWRFEPVLWQGQPILARVELAFALRPDGVHLTSSAVPNLPGELHTEGEFGLTNPMMRDDPDLAISLAMQVDRKVSAVAKFVVYEDGKVGDLVPVGANSELAWRAAADAVVSRSYTPGKLREIPVRVAYEQMINFRPLATPIAALSGARRLVDPVYPYERLLAQEPGFAVVKFSLTPEGAINKVELVEASHPDFGAALIAAADTWRFSPEAAAEKAERDYRHEFDPDAVSYGTRRFAQVVRAGGKIESSKVDKKLSLQWAPPLVYPQALLAEGPEGSASVEMVIDRAGLAQMPRVTKATRPEFGWAAATFVGGMRFEPVTRNGEAAELRVVVPVSFAPPPATEKPAETK